MKQFEYQIIEDSAERQIDEDDLDFLGDDGWELVAVTMDRNVDSWLRWVFKRPVVSACEE